MTVHEEMLRRELSLMEAIWTRDGDVEAVRTAVVACRQLQCPLPDWLADAILKMPQAYKGKRGRGGNAQARHKALKNDFMRFGMVDVVLGVGRRAGKKMTNKEAFEHVATVSLKSQNVTPRAVEESWRRIKREYGDTLK